MPGNAVPSRYDLIFLDTPPALGYLTINGLAAADLLLVPVGASFLEFDSTGRFFDMLHATFASIEEGENIAARALGLPETAFEWDIHPYSDSVLIFYEPKKIGSYLGKIVSGSDGEILGLDFIGFYTVGPP